MRPLRGFSDITDLLDTYDGKTYDIKGLKALLKDASVCIKSLRKINSKQYERLTQLNDNKPTSTD